MATQKMTVLKIRRVDLDRKLERIRKKEAQTHIRAIIPWVNEFANSSPSDHSGMDSIEEDIQTRGTFYDRPMNLSIAKHTSESLVMNRTIPVSRTEEMQVRLQIECIELEYDRTIAIPNITCE
jgi:hypothetical protein